jgi:hypothetical protein
LEGVVGLHEVQEVWVESKQVKQVEWQDKQVYGSVKE